MRILMTTDTIGGVWTLTRELTQQLLDRNHAIALVSFGRAPTREQEEWCSRIAAEHGDRFLFHAGDAPLEWMQDNATAFADGLDLLLSTAREFRADLLHSHQFCWGALPVDLPRLITAHSDVMSWSECCHPGGMATSDWLTHYCSLVQSGLTNAHAVVAPTAWMRTALNRHFRITCEFSVIPNGRTVPSSANVKHRKLQAVSVGRLWDKAKGMQTLLEIEPPLPILIAGEEKFESASATTGTLQALGVLDEAALFDVFGRSSIYIVTSFYEPFGLAPLEAALCGCAVIARNLPSLREVWSDDTLFYDSSDELVLLLRELTNNPKMLRTAQDRARARAQQFTAASMTDRYIALYESIIAPARTTSAFTQELVIHAA